MVLTLNYSIIANIPISKCSYTQSEITCFIYSEQNISCECTGNFLHFSANNLPNGLSINEITGKITGIPTYVGLFNSIINIENNISLIQVQLIF